MPPPSLKRATLALLLCCNLLACRESPQYPFDLIIAGGKLVDGSGSLWFPGDVAIRGDEIVHVGTLKDREQKGRRVIDARGLWVTPGFIDIHSHSDAGSMIHSNALSKVHQGVTTEILGGGHPDHAFHSAGGGRPASQAVPTDRTPLAQTFLRLQQGGIAVNVASYVRAGGVRRSVLGDDVREPTQPEVAAMTQLVRQAMLEGALGLASSARPASEGILSHEQLAELAREVKSHGGVYATEIGNSAAGIEKSLKEAIRLAKQAQIPVDIRGLRVVDRSRPRTPAKGDRFHREGEGVGAGRDRQPVSLPDRPGAPGGLVAPWTSDGGREELLKRLSGRDLRARILRELRQKKPGGVNPFRAAGGWEAIVLLQADSRKYQALAGKSIQAIAAQLGRSPGETLFDLLRESKGPVGVLYPLMSKADLRRALQVPWMSVGSGGAAGGSDLPGGGTPHPHGYGAFVRVLGQYVREEQVLDLEAAVHKMTGMNAAKLGLKNRGLLQVGMKADIAIFDAERVAGHASFQEPHRLAEGIEYVIVNGTLVIDAGNPLDARPGKVLYGPGKTDQ